MKITAASRNAYLLLLIALAVLSRLIYHVNIPLYEDEGLFLLDAGATDRFSQIYADTLYMKPPLGALYFRLVYKLAGEYAFLFLHITTTMFVVISSSLIFIIVDKVRNHQAAILASLFFLVSLIFSDGAHPYTPMGGGVHSSLELFQLVFLLGFYYFFFIAEKTNTSLLFLLSAVFVKQNVAILFFSIFKDCLKKWRFLTLLFLGALGLILLFDNIWFNLLYFPVFHYEKYGVSYKLSAIFNNFLKLGFGFNLLLAIGFIFSIPDLIRADVRKFAFILLLGFSLLSTPLYVQHFVVLPAFFIIAIFTTRHFCILQNWRLSMVMAVLALAAFGYSSAKNFEQLGSDDYLSKIIITPFRMAGRKDDIAFFYDFIRREGSDKTVYFYPAMIPHVYIQDKIKPIEKFASNDHFSIITKDAELRGKLLDAINKSAPTFIIRTESSDFDKYINKLINKKYFLYAEQGAVQIFKIKQ